MNKIFFLFSIYIFFYAFNSKAQEKPSTIKADTIISKTTDKLFVRSFPIIFLRPETGWGGGFAGTTNFNLSKKNLDNKTPSSQISWVTSYTEKKQFLALLPFNIYFKNRKFYSEGEIDFTNFSWDYWGNGNLTKDTSERFYTHYRRIIFNLMTKIHGHFFGGLKFETDIFKMKGIEKGGLLDTHTEIDGRNGGVFKGIGIEGLYDTRDNIYSAHKGWMIDLTYLYWNKFIYGDAEFNRLYIDAMKFTKINKHYILAIDINLQMNNGKSIPFMEYSALGGGTIMRGLYEGRYRDKFLANICLENRIHVYKRFGIVAFGNLGEVNSSIDKFNAEYLRWTLGGGVRYLLNSKERINIRFDYGFGPKTHGSYLTIGEAF
ncbi:MAG: hypothetical protein RL065_998 [Bacteroidota bacterium]|jgi:hypothetical protein